MIMKILVPLDGSVIAEAAMPVALHLASASKAPLVLLLVINRRSPELGPADAELASIREAQAYLESAKGYLTGGVEVTTAVWRGAPAVAIVKAAHVLGVDTIVMTSHGRSGREREMFGSVADTVLRGAPMTVVVVRPKRDQAQIPAGEAHAVAAGIGAD